MPTAYFELTPPYLYLLSYKFVTFPEEEPYHFPPIDACLLWELPIMYVTASPSKYTRQCLSSRNFESTNVCVLQRLYKRNTNYYDSQLIILCFLFEPKRPVPDTDAGGLKGLRYGSEFKLSAIVQIKYIWFDFVYININQCTKPNLKTLCIL